ncbi:MAG: site-specific recombinase [Bacteroidota bacterium]
MAYQELLQSIQNKEDNKDASVLISLVNETGIHRNNKTRFSEEKIKELISLLEKNRELADDFRSYLVNLFSNYNALSLYTDAGILPGHGFFAEAYKRLEYKILPPLKDKSKTEYLVRKIFYGKTDYRVIAEIDETLWLQLFEIININADISTWQQNNVNSILNALMILSQRITAIGLEPEILDKLPAMEDLQSPFFALNREVQHYVDSFKEDPDYINNNQLDYLQILVMCTQCTDSINELHKHKDRYGISIHLAYLMLRLEQHVKRLTTLLKLIHTIEKAEFDKTLFIFMYEVVHAENKKYSIRKHLNDNLSLIAYKITEHTSRAGEHYRTVDWKEYLAMFKSAMGGGLIVAFLVLLKVLAHHHHFPPFGEAFIYSMIYASGFITIHLMHLTLATKQPAMTANTIAASLDNTEKNDSKMLKTVQLIAEITRAQFISLIGNIIIVLPAAWVIGWIYAIMTGNNLITPEEAHDMLMKMHPWQSGSLFYAAIAGVFLMSSGIIAGYYDNKFAYGRIPERIQQHPLLKKIFSERRLKKISGYLQHNSGLLLGNLFLGIFLGTAPLLGRFFGLPIDVRHVTLSTGNFGLALQSGDVDIPGSLLFQISLSILFMGLINLFVSFGLAIYIAVRSRSLNISIKRRITQAITGYFKEKPLDFFIPPSTIIKEENKVAE